SRRHCGRACGHESAAQTQIVRMQRPEQEVAKVQESSVFAFAFQSPRRRPIIDDRNALAPPPVRENRERSQRPKEEKRSDAGLGARLCDRSKPATRGIS